MGGLNEIMPWRCYIRVRVAVGKRPHFLSFPSFVAVSLSFSSPDQEEEKKKKKGVESEEEEREDFLLKALIFLSVITRETDGGKSIGSLETAISAPLKKT